jgi:hypothetical protein
MYYGFAVTNNNSWNSLSGGGTAGATYTATGLPGGEVIASAPDISGALQPTGTDNGGSDQDAVAIMVSASGGTPQATTPLPCAVGRPAPGPGDWALLHVRPLVRPGHR